MWHNTPTPDDLREEFPELALQLDTEYIVENLDRLGLKHQHRYSKKSVFIEIEMQPNHKLRIAPVDIGANGYSEWLTWSWIYEGESEISVLKASIRAHLEIVEMKSSTESKKISFTSHQENIEQIIVSAITGVRQISGLRIRPTVIKQKNK